MFIQDKRAGLPVHSILSFSITKINIFSLQLLFQQISFSQYFQIPPYHSFVIPSIHHYYHLSQHPYPTHNYILMKPLSAIIKSRSDSRIFKAFQLSNNLQCIIINDKNAEKASTALSVGVGSFQDPDTAHGLAHYLEHMLFMGTTKFPSQNDYSDYLSKNSGMSNAYTSQEQTNYFFEVANPALEGALDRFAQFFISPLMADSSSERELNAVHSEHTKNLHEDNWRYYQLLKHTSLKNSPFNKFSTGDKTTLSNPSLRSMLLEFYNKHYSSNLMKLVVYSKQNVEKVSELVHELFSGIPNKQYSKYKLPSPPFDSTNLKNLFKIVPVKNKMSINYMWILPNQQEHYKNNPGSYFSHLIGHEGPGSLLSLLIKQGLAYGLSAESSDEYSTYTEFSIRISLTDKGLKNHTLITQYLMYYLQMLKQKGPQEWYFKQIQKINKIKFDYMDQNHGMDFVADLASKMHSTKINEIMIKNYLMEEWKPELITNYLQELREDNLRINITAQDFEKQTKEVEPVYGTKYSIEAIEKIVPRVCDVSFPPPNPFFPQNFDTILATQEYPVKIYESNKCEVFYKPDHRFNLPKGILKIRLSFKNLSSPKHQVAKQIYIKMLLNYLKEIEYMATTASIHTNIESNPYSVTFEVKGFNDSFPKFLDEYLNKILSFVPSDQQMFDNIKNQKVRDYNNFFIGNPYSQGFEYQNCVLKEGIDCEPEQKLQQLHTIAFSDITSFNTTWKQELFAEIYIGGNFTPEQASNLGKSIESKIQQHSNPLSKNDISSIRAINLKAHETWILHKYSKNQQELNSCFIYHFQFEDFNIQSKILQDLCLQIIKQPTFDYLRTKQQLGYIVTCFPDDNRGVLGISFLVQSNIKSSHELQKYCDHLITTLLVEKISTMSEEEFENYKSSLIISKSQKPKTLKQETKVFWNEIIRHSYEFARKEIEIENIPKVTLGEFQAFFNKVFITNPKKFETHVINPSSKEATEKLAEERARQGEVKIVPSIEWFKKRMPLYPDYHAHL